MKSHRPIVTDTTPRALADFIELRDCLNANARIRRNIRFYRRNRYCSEPIAVSLALGRVARQDRQQRRP